MYAVRRRTFVSRPRYSCHDWNTPDQGTQNVSAGFFEITNLDIASPVLNQFSLRLHSGRATNNRPLKLTVSRSATIRTPPCTSWIKLDGRLCIMRGHFNYCCVWACLGMATIPMLRQFSMKVKLACASDLLGIGDKIGQCDQAWARYFEGLLVLVGCPFPEIESERAVPRESTPVASGDASLWEKRTR